MGSAEFVSGWDTTILMVPFLGILVMYMFRLDAEVLRSQSDPKKAPLLLRGGSERPALPCPTRTGNPGAGHVSAKSKPD